MIRCCMGVGVVLLGVGLAAGPAGWAEAPEHEFVGVTMCKACHGRPPGDNPFEDWAKDSHARAYKTLAGEKARAQGAERGVADPQESPKCLKCHSTAFAFGETKVTELVEPKEGVSCESCHGPGMDYMPMDIMRNRDAAVAEGLVLSDKKVCLRCHNEGSPNWKADRYTLADGTKTPFDFAQALAQLRHPKPPKP